MSYHYKNKNFKQSQEGGEKTDKHEPVLGLPLEIKVYDNFDRALRAFRALVQKERILSSYKEKQHYEKPSDYKRRKQNEAKRKILELERESRKEE